MSLSGHFMSLSKSLNKCNGALVSKTVSKIIHSEKNERFLFFTKKIENLGNCCFHQILITMDQKSFSSLKKSHPYVSIGFHELKKRREWAIVVREWCQIESHRNPKGYITTRDDMAIEFDNDHHQG